MCGLLAGSQRGVFKALCALIRTLPPSQSCFLVFYTGHSDRKGVAKGLLKPLQSQVPPTSLNQPACVRSVFSRSSIAASRVLTFWLIMSASCEIFLHLGFFPASGRHCNAVRQFPASNPVMPRSVIGWTKSSRLETVF